MVLMKPWLLHVMLDTGAEENVSYQCVPGVKIALRPIMQIFVDSFIFPRNLNSLFRFIMCVISFILLIGLFQDL